MNDLYETRITTVRWLAYDLAGNAGWILWVVCTILCIKRGLTLFSAQFLPVCVSKAIGNRMAKPYDQLMKIFKTADYGRKPP